MSEYGSIPARPTLYNGIQMRSRLEADFAAFLDRQDYTWAYEPGAFASSSGQWLPDFRITESDMNAMYVELKPVGILHEWREERCLYSRVNAIMRKMMVARESDPKCHLWLTFWGYGGDEMILMMNYWAEDYWVVNSADPFLTIWPSEELQQALRLDEAK